MPPQTKGILEMKFVIEIFVDTDVAPDEILDLVTVLVEEELHEAHHTRVLRYEDRGLLALKDTIGGDAKILNCEKEK